MENYKKEKNNKSKSNNKTRYNNKKSNKQNNSQKENNYKTQKKDLRKQETIIPRKKKDIEIKKAKRKKVVSIIILSSIFAFSFTTIYFFVIHKELKIVNFIDKDKILVGEEYQDKKFTICYGTIINCKNIKYNIKGEVDTNHIGEYILKYHYKINNQEKYLKKVVTVYDDIKPEIIVDDELAFCKNGRVAKGKYHANDNYDGDITEKVKLSIEGDKSYLEVEDSSNNKTSIEVPALEFTSDPSITLNGNSTIYLYLTDTYKENGATASDICDGDITDKITISGNVNTSVVGTYTITYSVLNSEGRKAETKRTIIVQKKSAVINGSSCSKLGAIYLTFDDGPQYGTTETILNVLRDEGVKATFFVTNNGPDSLIQREYNEGHVVALHTASHNYGKIYSSVDAYFNDLYSVQNRVKRITGYESKIIRFPGGSSNTVSRKYQRGIMTTLTNEVLNRGFRYHDWNVDSNDAGACAKNGSSSCVYSYVIGSLSKNRCNMVLMHDIKSYTANAIRNIIQYGKNNGYTFEVITMDTPMVTQKVNN